MLRTVLPLTATAVAVMGQVQCDADSACVFEAKYKGSCRTSLKGRGCAR